MSYTPDSDIPLKVNLINLALLCIPSILCATVL